MPLVINGEEIPTELVHQEFSNIKSHYERMAQVSCCERDDEFMGYAKDNIIARVLLNQEAKEKGAPATEPEIDEAVAKLKEEHGGDEQFYLNAGITADQEDLVRQDVAGSLQVDSLLQEVWGEDIDPGEDDLRNYYDENIKEFLTIEEIRASHIFKSLSKVENRQELYDELREVRHRAVAGEDFFELAKANTDKGEDEIDLGFFKQGELMDEFEVIAFSLDVGDISPIFSSHWGFHLAKVTDRKAAEPKPFEEVKEEIREILIADDRQEKTKAFIEELKTKAAIEDTEDDEEGAYDEDHGAHVH